MVKDTTFEFRLDSQLKEKAKAKAAKEGRKLSDVLREFLEKWVSEEEVEKEEAPE